MQKRAVLLLAVFLLTLTLLPAGFARATEPSRDPFLRIESGMHTATISGLASDAAGRFLVSASEDKTVRVWEISGSGKGLTPIRTLRPPIGEGREGEIHAVAISPDGTTVACGGLTGISFAGKASVYIFDRASGELKHRVAGLPESIKGLAYSPDGRFLVVAMGGGRGVVMLAAETLQPVALDKDLDGDVSGLAFTPEGRLAVAAGGGVVRLYESGLARFTGKTLSLEKLPMRLSVAPRGEKFAVASSDNVTIFSAVTLSPIAAFTAADNPASHIAALAWASDGKSLHVALTLPDGSSRLKSWDEAGKMLQKDTYLLAASVRHLLNLADGSLAYAASSPELGIFSPDKGSVTRVRAEVVPSGLMLPTLQITDDGLHVSLDGSNTFSLPQRLILPDVASIPVQLKSPAISGDSVQLIGWQGGKEPQLNGKALKLDEGETSLCMSRIKGDSGIVIGTDRALRVYDMNGALLRKTALPGAVVAVTAIATADSALLVALLGDGTVRWYSAKEGKELLALLLHSDGKRWIVWTPTGYYDAAAGAENLIGWHFNNGADSEAAFFPASKFRSPYHRPDIIDLVLKMRDESAAIKVAAGIPTGKNTPPATYQPPVVTILSPRDGSRFVGDMVELAIAVKSQANQPVTGLKVLLDGRPLLEGMKELSAEVGLRRFLIPVPLKEVTLSVIAESGNITSEPTTVKLTRKADLGDEEEFSIQPKLYILAVGVGTYPAKDMKLAFAAKDANDFTAALLKQKGGLYRDVTSRVITDAAANRAAVLEGLEWLQRQTSSRDVAVMFLAGHGVMDSNGVYYFLPVDADTNSLKSTAVIFTEIRNTMAAIAGKALLFVDTCHSGNIMGSRRGVVDINGVINELASAEIGTVVFASSTGRQYSLEDATWGNGAFTKALLEGLGGKADYSGKGRITVNMLDLYLSERVKELTGGRQTPTTAKPQTVQDFPLALRL